jgi:hypothetical protein
MISGVTKVKCIREDFVYQKDNIYTYLRDGKCMTGSGICTAEYPDMVLLYSRCVEITVDDTTNLSSKKFLEKEW